MAIAGRFSVTRLGPGDTPQVAAINALFAEAFEDNETYGHRLDPAYLEQRLSCADTIVLIARDGERVVGALTGYVLRKLEQQRAEIYIYDLAVAADRRRRGVATGLIDHLRGIATEIGAWVIFVQADYGDDPAIALYEKLGSREDVMHFDIAPG